MDTPQRRTLIKGLAAGLALGGAGVARAAPSLSLDPATSAGRAMIYRKLAYAAGDRIGFSWISGTRYGVVDTDPVPLWDMHVGYMFRTRDLGEGRYAVTTLSASLYTDVITGAPLAKFQNPFTGKTVDVSYYATPPATAVFGPDGPEHGPQTPGTHRVETIGPVKVEGDRVSVREDTLLRVETAAPGQRPMRVNDLSTFFGSWREVNDPAVPMPLAGQMFSDINTWPAWLGMGDRPGDYYSRCLGWKVARFEDLPKIQREAMAGRYPLIARDPAAALEG